MDRRTAMFLTMLLGGGVVPRSLRAQDDDRPAPPRTRPRTSSSGGLQPARPKRPLDEPADAEAEPVGDDAASGLPPEPGQQWKTFNIARYTSLAHSQGSPQNAIVDWIFRRTGTSVWHGDKIAVLSASRTQIRAYNSTNILDEVGEIVERFTNATHDVLSVRVRFVTAVDTRWRYGCYTRLTSLGSGPQGQQIWTMKLDDAAFVLTQMQVYQGFRLLVDQKYDMANGQTLTIKHSEQRGFTGGLHRDSAAGLGYQPRTDQLEEGITLKFSPLLTFEGDMIEAAVDLTATTVRYFHRTRVLAPREIGQNELNVDVPEATETRLNQKIKDWPLGQTLLISAGIHPGFLSSKGGFLNLRIPGTVPTTTELLIFVDVDVSRTPRAASRDRDRERD